MTVTVDINVLLDVFQERHPHYAASARLVSLVTDGGCGGGNSGEDDGVLIHHYAQC